MSIRVSVVWRVKSKTLRNARIATCDSPCTQLQVICLLPHRRIVNGEVSCSSSGCEHEAFEHRFHASLGCVKGSALRWLESASSFGSSRRFREVRIVTAFVAARDGAC